MSNQVPLANAKKSSPGFTAVLRAVRSMPNEPYCGLEASGLALAPGGSAGVAPPQAVDVIARVAAAHVAGNSRAPVFVIVSPTRPQPLLRRYFRTLLDSA